MEDKEIAIRLTEMINNNINEYEGSHFLNGRGVVNTYKRVLEETSNDK